MRSWAGTTAHASSVLNTPQRNFGLQGGDYWWPKVLAPNYRCSFPGSCVMEETHLVVSSYRQGNSIWPRDDRRLAKSLKSSKYTPFFPGVWSSGGLMKPAGPGTITLLTYYKYVCVHAFLWANEQANGWSLVQNDAMKWRISPSVLFLNMNPPKQQFNLWV